MSMNGKHRLSCCVIALIAAISARAAEIVVQQPPPFEGGIPKDCRPLAYPTEALRYELEGESIVEFLIDEDGNVRSQGVVKSSGWKLLDQVVLESMGACRYTPITHDGKPVGAQWKKFSYVWTLRDPGESPRTSFPVLLPQSCPASDRVTMTDVLLNTSGILMRFLVSPEGIPFGIKVERGSIVPAIDNAAVAALQRCRFQPTVRNGLPVLSNGFATYTNGATLSFVSAPVSAPAACGTDDVSRNCAASIAVPSRGYSYSARIIGAIKEHTNYDGPIPTDENPAVLYKLELLADGTITKILLLKSSNIPAFDEAVRRGILRASPLPPRADGVPELKLEIAFRMK